MKLRSVFIAYGLTAGLLGCSTGARAPLNPPQLVSTSDTDMAIQLFMQSTILLSQYYGYETIDYETISDKSVKAGFKMLPFMPPEIVRATPPLTKVKPNTFSASSVALRAKIDTDQGYKWLVKYYIKTGWQASQLICRNHILDMQERNKYLEFLQTEFGVGYTFATGVLALANPNGTILKSVLLSRTAADDSVSAYRNFRYLSVDDESARLLVESAQNKYAKYYLDKVDSSEVPTEVNGKPTVVSRFTFSEALNAVSTIEYQCTREGIRHLLNRAVSNTPTNLEVDDKTGAIIFTSNKPAQDAVDKKNKDEGK